MPTWQEKPKQVLACRNASTVDLEAWRFPICGDFCSTLQRFLCHVLDMPFHLQLLRSECHCVVSLLSWLTSLSHYQNIVRQSCSSGLTSNCPTFAARTSEFIATRQTLRSYTPPMISLSRNELTFFCLVPPSVACL